MRAIHLIAFGNPAQGLEFVQIPEPAALSAFVAGLPPQGPNGTE